MSYGKVHDAYWDSDTIDALSDRAALLGLFLISGPHRNAIGCFKLGIGEDEDFFRRLRAKGLRCGATGGAFVHHFGSATLGPLRARQGKGFEEANLKRLRARWGRNTPTRLERWVDGLRRGWDRLRWGHLLKE